MIDFLVFVLNVARDWARERLGLPPKADWSPRRNAGK